MLNRIGFFLLFISLFGACNQSQKEPSDTAVSGQIHIAVDEAFQPLIMAQINAFQVAYPKANIVPHFVSEDEAFGLLLKDSVRMVVTGRDFNADELAFFKEKTIKPKSLKIATDAIGVVVNISNPDSMLTMDQLKAILTNRIANWKMLSGKGKNLALEVVFDKNGSSNYKNILKNLGLTPDSIKVKVSLVGGDREVINYVNQNEQAIGFMGVNWISDTDDPTQTRFRKGVSVVGLLPDSISAIAKVKAGDYSEYYYQPFQAYLVKGFYPLIRDVVVCSREARTGLATGFTAWMASDKGQRIVLKAGLLPATMPIRLVKIKKDNDLTD